MGHKTEDTSRQVHCVNVTFVEVGREIRRNEESGTRLKVYIDGRKETNGNKTKERKKERMKEKRNK
jgi:hypothetical protein